MTTPVQPPNRPAADAPAPQAPQPRQAQPTVAFDGRPADVDYTHRTWLDDMADVLGLVAGICGDFEVMDATLRDVRAGRTHLQLVGDCHATGLAVMVGGVRHVKNTDDRYLPVFDAIQRAGGQAEVAQDKRYHDRL